MSLRRANRIDANQPEIVKAIRKIGAIWIPTIPPFGCDGLVLWRGLTIFIEIKDGAKVPSARKLTDGELKLKATVDAANGRYAVWETVDAAIGYLEAIR